MTSTEFSYFLMGFFEIGEFKTTTVDEQKTTIIKKHLQLVFKYEKTPSSFCHWLKGFFDSGNISLNSTQTTTLLTELKKIFKLEIDLSYTNDAVLINEMNYIHNGINNGNDGLMRC